MEGGFIVQNEHHLYLLITVGGLHVVAVGVLLSQGRMLAAHRRRSEAAEAGPPTGEVGRR